MDTLTPAERSAIMSRVRGKNTRPELAVRRLLSSLGYRYRLHVAKLPGKPDIVLSSRRRAIFVHGCFWHRHIKCPLARMPKSRISFWSKKLEGNRARDLKNLRSLRRLGWKALVVWECELRNEARLTTRLRRFFEEAPNAHD